MLRTTTSISQRLLHLSPCVLTSPQKFSGTSRPILRNFGQLRAPLVQPLSSSSYYSTMTTSSRAAFCQKLGIKHPIVCPPMANCTGGVLAAEVSKAGGLGLVGHAGSLDGLKSEVEKGRKHLGLSESDPLPFGVGLVLWKLEEPEVSSSSEASRLSSSFLSYVISISPHTVWLSFSPSLESWVKRYRSNEGTAEKGRRAFILIMTARTEDTIAASKWEGVDAVVAQGTEAGGHGPSHDLGLPLERLLEKVSPHYEETKRPFLLAAGGISSSSKIKEVFEEFEKVAGVVVGTGFTVAEESLWSKGQKKLVVETKGGEETDRGMEWDEVRGSMGWPEGVDGRAIRNRTRGREGTVYGGDLEGEKGEGPDLDEVGVWAGTGVGDVKEIKPAREILEDLVSQL